MSHRQDLLHPHLAHIQTSTAVFELAGKLLLESGADAAAENGQGKTAAELAMTNKKQAVVDLLAAAASA